MKLISDGKPLYLGNKKQFRLITDWQWQADKKGKFWLVVPKGYVSDLASVPPIFFWWQWGKWNIAAIAHDYIYEHGYINGVNPDKSVQLKLECDRLGADLLFFTHCLVLGVNPITACLMFLACRLFGWIWWQHDN